MSGKAIAKRNPTLMGEVYTQRVRCCAANAMAYSATTVLPADV